MPVLLLPLAMSVTSPLLPLAASYGGGGGGRRNVTIVSILCDDETSTDGGRLRRENREVRTVLKERRSEEAFVRNRRMSVRPPRLFCRVCGIWARFCCCFVAAFGKGHTTGVEPYEATLKLCYWGENVIFVVHHAGEGRKTE